MNSRGYGDVYNKTETREAGRLRSGEDRGGRRVEFSNHNSEYRRRRSSPGRR